MKINNFASKFVYIKKLLIFRNGYQVTLLYKKSTGWHTIWFLNNLF